MLHLRNVCLPEFLSEEVRPDDDCEQALTELQAQVSDSKEPADKPESAEKIVIYVRVVHEVILSLT